MFKALMKCFSDDEKKARRALYMLIILLETHSEEVKNWDDKGDEKIYLALLSAARREYGNDH